MYYVKYNSEKLEINDENVFSDCPICGREVQADLSIAINDSYIEYDSSVFCDTCTMKGYSKRYIKACNDGTWQAHGALMLVDDINVRKYLMKNRFKAIVCPITGDIPHCRIGNKILINLDVLECYLTNPEMKTEVLI